MTLPTTQKAIYFTENGDRDVLKYEDVPVPKIGEDEILIKNRYAGINFIEVYFRKGVYPSEKPYTLGREAAGEVVAVGSKVDKVQVGDKVGYLYPGSFAQYTKVPASHNILKLPKDTSDDLLKLVSASLLQGLTALTFIYEAYDVKEGDYILVTAAAGGVGLILNQLLSKVKKAHVIALASTEEKLKLAKEAGAEFLINSSTTSQEEQIKKILEITNGEGVAASFDSVGKDTLELSLGAVARKGTFVSYGNASGKIAPFELTRLGSKNIKLLRPTLFNYITTPDEYKHYTDQLFELIKSGVLKIDIHKVYPLEKYSEATGDLEGRRTTGKLVLEIPQ